jgi:hypothetical protein
LLIEVLEGPVYAFVEYLLTGEGAYPSGMNSTYILVQFTSQMSSTFVCTEHESCSKYPSLPFIKGNNTSLTHCFYVSESNQPQGCTAHLMLLCV